jgi:general secretion pathway protein C
MAFDRLLKRYFAGVILALVALVAYFHATIFGQIIGWKFAPDDKSLAGGPAVARAASPAPAASDDHSTSARAILDHNPFDSVTPRPLDAPPETGDGGSEPVVVDLQHYENAPLCEGMKVLIVVASPTDPLWSMAALSTGSGPTKLFRLGDDVGGKTVQIIEWNRVVMSAGSALCQLQMFRPAKPAASVAAVASAPPPAAAAAAGATKVPADIASKIQKVSASEFNVDRQVVDKILENQAELMRSARIVPEQENGKVVGIRLFGIRPDTLLGTLGMENGDRLQTINGFDMASPEKALEAYARLRTADHLTVQVNRRGQNMNLDFNIK